MIFSELYGAYYNTVAAVLRKAVQRPLTKEDLRTVIERCAFSESVLSIEPALTSSCSGRTAQRPSSIRRPCRLRCCKSGG